MLNTLPTPLYMLAVGFGRLRRPGFDGRAAIELQKFEMPFYPSTRYALAPSALLTVVNEIILNKRQLVVEFGMGVSSLYIAKALRKTGGSLISVDHDSDWVAFLKDQVGEAELSDIVTLIHAPLKEYDNLEYDSAWYDRDVIQNAIAARAIDLLIVDGPVASRLGAKYSRFPAVPELVDNLAENYAVFLDDLHRVSHRRITQKWSKILGIEFNITHSRGGFAYGIKGPAYDPIM